MEVGGGCRYRLGLIALGGHMYPFCVRILNIWPPVHFRRRFWILMNVFSCATECEEGFAARFLKEHSLDIATYVTVTPLMFMPIDKHHNAATKSSSLQN